MIFTIHAAFQGPIQGSKHRKEYWRLTDSISKLDIHFSYYNSSQFIQATEWCFKSSNEDSNLGQTN